MNSGSESIPKNQTNNQEVNQDYEDREKKPLVWWFVTGLLAFALLAVTIALIVVVAVRKPETKEKEYKSYQEKSEKEICITSDCIRLANSLLTSMDDTKDPCEDFYKFACGKYANHNQIPANANNKKTWRASIDNKLSHDIKDILEQSNKVGDFQGISMARTFYNSCLSKEKETNEQQFKHEQVQNVLGDWPTKVGQWSPPSTYSWEEQVVKLLKLNVDALLNIRVIPHDTNSTQNIIEVSAMDFSYSPKLPASENTTVDEQNLDILKQKLSEVPKRRKVSQLMTIKEMKQKFRQTNWDITLSRFPENADINENDIVKIISPDHLEHILNVFNSTKLRDVQNFLFEDAVTSSWKFVQNFSWKLCMYNTLHGFTSIISHEYVKKHVNMKEILAVKDITIELKSILIEKLSQADWLDRATRKRAIDKATQMLLFVGQPDEYFSEDFLMEDYKEIDIKANEYFNNFMKVRAIIRMQLLGKLRQPNERNNWPQEGKITPLKINALYRAKKNSVYIPAAYIVFPVMSSKVPSFFNYGSIGFYAGHEMTHGFDINGRNYNEIGAKENWWSNASNEKFHDKASCFIAQFSNTIDIDTGYSLDGQLTLRENMADTGGMKLSYTAFMKWLAKHPSVAALPHFDKYTPEQMFFLSFANKHCDQFTEEERLRLTLSSTHSLGRYRLNFSLKNLREFGDSFNCPTTAKMRLPKRCEMWQ